jgi:hypothetical protein
MDVYHKVLTRLFQDSGGKETVKLDMREVLKQEGFFASRDEILGRMIEEGWATEADTKYFVYLTHWGIAEAKKTLSRAPDNSRALEKESKRLISTAKEFVVMTEEFAGEPTKSRLSVIEKQCAELGDLVSRVRANMD